MSQSSRCLCLRVSVFVCCPFLFLVLFLQAGDSSTITVRIEVNAWTIKDVNLPSGDLNDILILRVLNGADKFIAVSGTLKKTCVTSNCDP